MALFQDEQITEEQFNTEHNLNKNDIFSKYGYDDILKARKQIRENRIEEEKQWVENLISPEIIDEWKKQGSMTALQVWHMKNKNELVPYMGTWNEGTKSFKIKDISDKLQTGQNITPEERKIFEDFVLDLAEVQTRGYTFGGSVTNIGLETIPFMAEFALGLLCSGGASSFGATSSKLSTEFVKKGLTRQIAEGVGKIVYNSTINPKTLAFTAITQPQQVRARFGDVMLSDSLAITPEGQAILKEAEIHPALAFVKALALTQIEVGSELSGDILVRPFLKAGEELSKVIASPILKRLPKGFTKGFVKLAEFVTKLPFAKAVDQLGFNGILEEMGEERVGDLLKTTLDLVLDKTGLNNNVTFEDYLDAIFPNITQGGIKATAKQLAEEAVAFGMTGIGANAVHNSIKAIPVIGEKYTKDDFLLDVGIFRKQGYDSYLDSKIREALKAQGKKDEEIENALDSSSRNDKVQYLKDIGEKFDTKKEYDVKNFERDLERIGVEDRVFEKFTAGGEKEDVALANAKLFGQFFRKYGARNEKTKKKFYEWFNKFEVRYDVTPEELNEQLKQEVLYQSAMYKSPKKSFEEFYNQVQQEKNPKQKAYYTQQTKQGVNIDIFHDVVRHDEKKHSLSKEEWNELFNSIDDNIEDKIIANKSYYRGTPLLLKINVNGDYYGVSMEVFPNRNIITTAFKSTEKGVDTWFKKDKKKSAGTTAPNHQSGSSIVKNNNVISGQTLTDIINDVKTNFNPNVKNNVLFQSAYHGTLHRFEEFSTEHIGSGEGAQAHGWGLYFAENKDISEDYRKTLSDTNGIGTEIKVDNKTYKKVATNTYRNKDDLSENVDDYLNKALNFIEAKGTKKDALKYIQKQIDTNKDAGYFDDAVYYIRIKDALNEIKQAKITKYADDYGQLFKVDIPENDVLLDENLPFSKQPKKVQEGLRSLPAEILEEIDFMFENNNENDGEDIYGEIVNIIGKKENYQLSQTEAEKRASLLLNKHGIKGITYDGRQDGRCYVIFDDKAVQVLKTYYQSANNDNQNVVDLTNDFDKTPTLQEVKEYINEIVEKGTKFATLSPEWFVDVKGGRRTTNKILNAGNYKHLEKMERKRHNKYIMSLEKLLANAEYIGAKENTKQDKKTHVENYHYFKTNVKIGDKVYEIIFDTEEYKNDNKKSTSVGYAKRNSNKTEVDTNSITDNKENLNPKTVHLYNISEYKTPQSKKYYQGNYTENAENEKLIAGFTYQEVMDKLTEIWDNLGTEGLDEETQDKLMAKLHILEDAFKIAEGSDKFKNEDRNHEIMLNAYYIMNNQEIPQDYVKADAKSNRSYNDYKEIHKKKKDQKENEYYGYFSETNDKNIITIMANSNSSTALHELGHLFLDGLNELAKVDENAQKQLEAVNKWLGYSGEYTIAQQEKFARSFEAYLYRGKAPNNNLRQVFENFKEWLKSVYEHVSDLVAKGADISDEVTEMFDKMFGEDEYYQEKKEATELLRKVKSLARKEKSQNNIKRKEKTLTEGQKRCKQVSYEILSVATGKDINYLKRVFETDSNKNGYGKRRENIEELLEHADDKITTSGGMREHWKEFYSDTGVSYNNDEIDGDFNLAQKALQTILNKDYFDPDEKFDNELTDRAEYFERAVDNAQRQYKVLIRSFKNGNRNVALSAIYEWLDGLDNEIRQDYEDRFIFDSAIIERDEKVDKFDKAKREILSKAMELENKYSINNNEKYQELVKEIMKNLNFLQPSDKAKLTANILDVPSTQFLMSSIDNIMDVAKTMEDVNLRIELSRRIHSELQDTKNIKKNGRSVGKYDYRSNKLFAELREMDRMSSEKADELRLEASKFATAEDNGLSKIDKLKMKFLSYKAGGRNFTDTELLKELYEEIINIKLIGKSAKSELDLMEKISEDKDIDELINIVENKKEASLALKAYVNGIGNLESTLNAIFNKKIANKYGAELLYAETNAQAFQYEQKTRFEKAVAKIYNLPEWCWDKKILDYLSEKHTFVEFRRKYDKEGNLIKTRNIDRTLTKMDIIGAYIWSKNEVLEKRLKNQFGEDTLESMFELLSAEDEKFAQLMMSTAQSFYPLVNKAFVKKYGLDLPKVSCYFPSTPERGTEVDLYNDYSSMALGNGFTKARAQSEILPMDFHNPVTTLYSHIDGVAKFAFMSEHLDNINLRFKDTDLRRVIINKYGEDAYRTLEQILINVTYKKESQVFNGFNKVVDHLVTNWVSTNVAIKPIVGLKQLLSANNYAVDMPYMEWQAGFMEGLLHPKQTIDYMMKIPYLKARFGGSMTNEFLKQTVENSAFATSKKLKDLCGLFIKTGDVGAIVFGGKPYIDYLIKQGMSEEEAIKQFVLSTNRTQQSSAVSSLSNLQVNWGRNPFLKLFIAYKNSPLQYIRMCGDALVAVANGEMSKQQCAKTIFQYAYVQPFLYAVATSGSLFRFLFTGDDDDLIKDLTSSIFNLNADGIPMLGDIYKYAIDKIVYKEKNMVQTTPLIGDIEKEIAKLAKEDLDAGDYLKSVAYLLVQLGLGYNTNALATMGSGVGDAFTGEGAQGALKMFGYTDYRAKHITGKK